MTKRFWVCALGGLAAGAVLSSGGAVRTFTGAKSGLFSDPANWEGGALPENGDSLLLASTTQTTLQNDLEGLVVSNLTFAGYGTEGAGGSGAGNNARLTGNGFTVKSGGALVLTSKVRLNQHVAIALEPGEHELSVNEGSARWDVTGDGAFTGPGALTLAKGLYIPYSDSSFTGGFTARPGANVFAFVDKPFGDAAGPVVFEKGAKLWMYRKGIAIPNAITFKGESDSAGNIFVTASGTFAGAVTFEGQQRIKTAKSEAPLILTFGGPVVQRGGGALFVTNLGVRDCRHEIVFADTATLTGDTFWMDGEGSTVRFQAAGNQFSAVRLWAGQVFFEAPDAAPPGAVLGLIGSAGNTRTPTVFVEGDQTVARLCRFSGTLDDFAVSSRTGGRLIVRAGMSEVYPGVLSGALGFVWAPKGAHTFRAEGVCSFSGALVVSNGTFEVGTAAASLTNLSSLAVLDGATLRVAEGATVRTRLETLELASSASLVLPKGAHFVVDRLVCDGQEMAARATYTGGGTVAGATHLDALPANVTVYVRAQPGIGEPVVWTGAGGAADATSLGVNWASGQVPALDEGALVTAQGGASMTFPSAAAVNGFRFGTGAAFTVAGAEPLDLYWGGVALPKAAAASGDVAFRVPVRLAGEQTWDVGANLNLTFERAVADADDRSYDVCKVGGGAVRLAATNTFSGDLVVSNGAVVAACDESLGDPGRGAVVVDRASTAVHPRLQLEGPVKVSRPVVLSGTDTDSSFYAVRTGTSGVCELAGPVTIADTHNKRFRADGTSTLLFSGGVSGSGLFYMQGTGKYVISNTPAALSSRLYSDVRADITLATPGNVFGGMTLMNATTLRIAADDALAKPCAVNLAGGAVLDLDGHDLAVSDFTTIKGSTAARVTSARAATLHVRPAALGYSFNGTFEGGASLCKAGKNLSLGGMHSSTGVLQSVEASLILEASAGWTNGTVMVTNGNAAVLLRPGAQLGRHADVRLATGGKLTLYPLAGTADTAPGTFTCRNLYLDGVRQRPGTYGAAASAAAHRSDAYFMANHLGVLHVLGDGRGLVLTFR